MAGVNIPPLAAVAAILLASISATEDICPFPGFEPSLLGKFLVTCLILSIPFAGVSPAPKHGPQNAVLIVAPAAINSDIEPFWTSSIITGWDDGYTDNENSSFPQLCPFIIDAASTILL